MTLKWTLPILVTLAVVGSAYIYNYYYHERQAEIVFQVPAHSVSTTTSNSATPSAKSDSKSSNRTVIAEPTPILSSSTLQIGDFEVVANCSKPQGTYIDILNVQILHSGSLIQTLGGARGISGTSSCPAPEEQDINFDGYSDFYILDGDGSGGGSYTYWLFNTSTNQFYCPEANNSCGFMNPQFDPVSKTITSTSAEGMGHTHIDTYGVTDGKLVLIKSEDVNY